ncbi:TKL protein kinase [Saprolegnia parasitica CBS 223.65]|uniref:TKL protein kinase n=1 Tax=Saprolegnia parasitica (strain CBS 223.65) TaxID=695850 RepID=A0A067D649_SAPPC|nr:TKL protein kinase [Saprolegnia parasitica CBS 223.65]KDO34487.1 TKL protein kinase [Saprolegnia parasitica CBS 223.65]|eukprot:XP_012194830.1 TKL protein kinase [Saprolegnia parasitica CBS 223.65]
MAMTARVGVWVLGTDRSNRRLVLYVAFSYMALILLHAIALGLWLFWLVMLLLLQLLLWPCQPSRTFFRDFVRETVCSGYLEWLCRWDVRVRNVYAVKLYVEPTLPVDLQAHVGRVFAYFLFWKSFEFCIAAITLYLVQLPYSTCHPDGYAFDTATRAYVAVARDCHYAEWSIALVLPVLLHLRLVAWCSVRMCEMCIVPIFRPSLATYQSLVDVNGCEDAPLRLRPTAPRGEDTLAATTQVKYDELSPTNRPSQSFQLPRVWRAIDDPTISARSLSTIDPLVSELEVVPETFHEIAYGDLTLKEAVGHGHFGDAHRASYLGQDVVVKTLRPTEFGDNADQIVAAFRHEAAVLSLFGRHPNIVPFVGACTDLSHPLSLVTEYLPFGSLEDQFGARRSPLSTDQKTRILCDAASGFLNMHEGGFIHRDIAARNCLVDDQLRARVCDFGLCRRVHSYGGGHFAEGAMPLKYLAPESLTPPHSFSFRSDSYSFGVLIWETFTESRPFPTMTSAEAAAYVLEGHRLELGETIPTPYQSLIARCLQDDPAKRPSMATIVQELTHAMARK